jgi:hypothetical protein
MKHYKEQLSRVQTKGAYRPTFKICSGSGDTKWMDLNQESAQDLREWLDERFPREKTFMDMVQEKYSMMKLEDVPDKKSEL